MCSIENKLHICNKPIQTRAPPTFDLFQKIAQKHPKTAQVQQWFYTIKNGRKKKLHIVQFRACFVQFLGLDMIQDFLCVTINLLCLCRRCGSLDNSSRPYLPYIR